MRKTMNKFRLSIDIIRNELQLPAILAGNCPSEINQQYWPVIVLWMQMAYLPTWAKMLRIHLALFWICRATLEKNGVDEISIEEFEGLEKKTVNAMVRALNMLAQRHGKAPKLERPLTIKTKRPIYAFLNAVHDEGRLPLEYICRYDLLGSTFKAISPEAISGLHGLIKYHGNVEDPFVSHPAYKGGLALRRLLLFRPSLEIDSLRDALTKSQEIRQAFKTEYAELERKKGVGKKYDPLFDFRPKNISHTNALAEAALVNRRLNDLKSVLNGIDVLSKNTPGLTDDDLNAMISDDDDPWSEPERPRKPRSSYSAGNTGRSPQEGMPEKFPGSSLGHGDGPMNSLLDNYYRIQRRYFNERTPAFNRNLLSPQELAEVFEEAFPRPWHELPTPNKIAAMETMANLFGCHQQGYLRSLVGGDVSIAGKLLRKHGRYLDINLRLPINAYPVELSVKKLFPKNAGNAFPPGAVVSPWPHWMRAMLNNLILECPAEGKGRPWLPEDVEMARILPGRATSSRLAIAGEAYLCQNFGLDPEALSLVSGRPVLRRKTSIFYFRIDYEKLAK